MRHSLLLSTLGYASLAASLDWTAIGINSDQWGDVIERDVCVVGGGASGIHAAVSLIDLNKTVVVVERNDFIGGHTHTYIDPDTGIALDTGVVVYQPIQVVEDFFGKFNVPLLNISSVAANVAGQPANTSLPASMYNTFSTYADFRDGSAVTPSASEEEAATAWVAYAELLAQYSYLLEGYDLPDPVPEDLYMPFGEFLEKYNVSAIFPIVYEFAQGMGDILSVSTIYVIKYFNLQDLQYAASGYLTEAQGNNSLLYTRAGEYIGSDNILLESTVVSASRKNTTSGLPELLVSTPDTGLKMLSCGQILLAIPPTLSNLAGWDLTPEEHAVFGQYVTAAGYWAGLVRNVGLNQSVEIINAAAGTPYNIPVLPALYYMSPTGVVDDTWWIKFGADTPTLPDAQVRAYAERQIATLQTANGVPVTAPEWLSFESHSPFHLQVTPDAIRDGFFRNLTALQGGLDGTMFYTGAAFHTQVSTLLWQFNQDVVIPKMMNTTNSKKARC